MRFFVALFLFITVLLHFARIVSEAAGFGGSGRRSIGLERKTGAGRIDGRETKLVRLEGVMWLPDRCSTEWILP